MRKFLQSPAVWAAFFCALLSAGLWSWSRRIPESIWESSIAGVSSTPAPEISAVAITETPTPAPTPAEGGTVAAASPTPSETPAATPAPSGETVAAATPPAPADAAAAAPAPSLEKPMTEAAATPAQTPPPAPTATPEPTPMPLQIAEIAGQPQLWPRQVVLMTTVSFPVILNGINRGNIQLPAGREVNLRKVNPDGTVELEMQGAMGATTKVNAQATNVLARARDIAAAKAKKP